VDKHSIECNVIISETCRDLVASAELPDETFRWQAHSTWSYKEHSSNA